MRARVSLEIEVTVKPISGGFKVTAELPGRPSAWACTEIRARKNLVAQLHQLIDKSFQITQK